MISRFSSLLLQEPESNQPETAAESVSLRCPQSTEVLPESFDVIQPDTATEGGFSGTRYLYDVRNPLRHCLRLSMRPNTHNAAESGCPGILYLQGARKPLG
jgi:hypothetical protein